MRDSCFLSEVNVRLTTLFYNNISISMPNAGGVSATAPVRESGGSLRLGDPEVSPYVELRENNVSLRADFKRGRAMLRMAYDL